MKSADLSLAALSLLILFGLGGITVHAQAVGKLFTVNHNGDSQDAVPGDRICADAGGQCTLRAAIQESNATQHNVIIFAMPWPAVIELTMGTLTITGTNMSIVGPGARRLAIQPGPGFQDFRLFTIVGSNIMIRGLSIRNAHSGHFWPGAAIRIGTGTVQLTDIALLNNVSEDTGGAISNNGNLTISRSLIAGNSSFRSGGAIYNAAGSTARITNSTITGSYTAGTGGAIWNGGNLLLANNTISDNSALVSAGNVFSDQAGSINVLNTIIGSSSTSTVVSLSGAFTSLGNNIVTDARSSTGFANGVNNDQVSDSNSIDPLLGPLADNGGQTDTRALMNASPAINTGNSCVRTADCPITPQLRLFTDQRTGYNRMVGSSVDIGSFEFGASQFSSSVSFSLFTGFGRRAGYMGSIAVLTDVITNEKRYSSIRPFGSFGFRNLPGEVYILETKSKRAGTSMGPSVFAFNDFSFGIPFLTADVYPDGTLVIREGKTEDHPK